MDSQLFLVTYDHPNFQWTVLGSGSEESPDWAEDKLRDKVPELGEEITNLRIWGVKPGPNNEQTYRKMKEGDYLLFYRNKKYRWAGIVGDIFQNERFDQEYWVEETKCTMLYTINDLKEIDLSRQKINEVLEYEKRGDTEWNPQGIQRVDPSKLEKIIENYGSLDQFVNELVDEAEQDPWWK
jgi:hypothetical protein